MPVSSTKIKKGFSFQIQSGEFSLTTDVSKGLGGENQGPSPHDYFEIALAACTAVTLQMYAKRKSIPLEYADVKVQITAEGKSNEILREIALHGDLSEEQRTRLFEIAEKCPIHKLMSAGAKITSRLV